METDNCLSGWEQTPWWRKNTLSMSTLSTAPAGDAFRDQRSPCDCDSPFRMRATLPVLPAPPLSLLSFTLRWGRGEGNGGLILYWLNCIFIYLSFSAWLTSLTMTISRFIYVAANYFICILHYFVLFNGWVIFFCIYVPHLLYPLLCPGTFRLLPCLAYCK